MMDVLKDPNLIINGGLGYLLIKEVIVPLLNLIKKPAPKDRKSDQFMEKLAQEIQSLAHSVKTAHETNVRDHQEIRKQLDRMEDK